MGSGRNEQNLYIVTMLCDAETWTKHSVHKAASRTQLLRYAYIC